MADDDSWDLTPRIEHRAVERVETVNCSTCGRDVELPREEPWLLAGDQQRVPLLVSFRCPHCEGEIWLA